MHLSKQLTYFSRPFGGRCFNKTTCTFLCQINLIYYSSSPDIWCSIYNVHIHGFNGFFPPFTATNGSHLVHHHYSSFIVKNGMLQAWQSTWSFGLHKIENTNISCWVYVIFSTRVTLSWRNWQQNIFMFSNYWNPVSG